MRKNILIGISFVLVTFIFTTIVFVIRGNRPMVQAKKEAITIASKHADLKSVDKFYWFTRKETTFTLVGKNAKNEGIIVFIPEDGSELTVCSQADGITENEALKVVADEIKPHRLLKVSLGLVENDPTWEVMTEDEDGVISYYLVDFGIGKIIGSMTDV